MNNQQIPQLDKIQMSLQNKHIPKKFETKKNDYCKKYLDSGERPQNFIRDILPQERFIDYPKLNELIRLKDEQLLQKNQAGMCIKQDINDKLLNSLGKFDVILMDPPWEEYKRRVKMCFPQQAEKYQQMTFQEINIESLADQPSFIFLWVGSEGLEEGRELLKKWGFKRCEDIVWVKTNKNKQNTDQLFYQENSLLQRVKEHCIVGLKEQIIQRRTNESQFIHPNIDTDVIVDEEPEFADTKKPDEIYNIIERFCLGRKRIELFGRNKRPGWLSVGPNVPQTDFDKDLYERYFQDDFFQNDNPFFGGRYIGTTPEIEHYRPKSPKQQAQIPQTQQMQQQQMYVQDNQILENFSLDQVIKKIKND